MISLKPVRAHSILPGLSLFFLLMGIYLLRSIRDEAAVSIGVQHLGWLISATFGLLCLLSLFVRLKNSRSGTVYQIAVLLVTLVIGTSSWFRNEVLLFLLIGATSLLLVSLFWGALNGRFDKSTATKTYPSILLFGSFGAIAGPSLVTALSHGGTFTISLIAGVLMWVSAILLVWVRPSPKDELAVKTSKATKPKPWPLATLILLYSLLGTVLYGEHLAVVEFAGLSTPERLQFFGQRDLYVGIITFALQFVSHRTKSTGSWLGLKLMPVLTLGILLAIGLFTSLETVLWSMVLFRSFNYSYLRPAREVYHLSGLNRFKIFIDTVIYRAGDLIGIWLFQLLMYHQFDYLQIGLMMIPLVLAWVVLNQRIVKTLKA